MDTLNYILNKFNLSFGSDTPMPIEIRNVGRNNLPDWLHELNFKSGVEVGVDYLSQTTLDALFAKFQQVIAPYPNYQAIKDLSMNAVKSFEDNSLDFVYIDANHSEPYITQDITEWYKKLKVGGIISGHDYIQPARRGRKDFVCNVIDATQRFTKEKNIRPWFILGLKSKENGIVRDSTRSWMWVKV